MSGLRLIPCSIQDAKAFVLKHHRHHKPPPSGLFALAAAAGDEVVAVVIVGRPVSRILQDGWTVEVTRMASDGTRNSCSFLYRAAWRAAVALGWKRLVTYTLPSETGASLRGAGFSLVGAAGGGTWNRAARARVDKHPTQGKLRWQLEEAGERSEARTVLARDGARLRDEGEEAFR